MSGTSRPDIKLPGGETKDKMYEPKHKKKLVRVLTVVAYVFSVSLAAITLSLFYIFIYNPDRPTGKMVGKSYYFSNNTVRYDDDRMMNRTWIAPEEPRALPVQIAQQSQLDEVAHLHSQQVPESWEDIDYYKSLRGKRSIKSFLKVLKLKPIT